MSNATYSHTQGRAYKRTCSKDPRAKQERNQTQVIVHESAVASPIKNLKVARKEVRMAKGYLSNYLQSKENKQMENVPNKSSERSANREITKSAMSSIILLNKENSKKVLQPKLNDFDNSIDNLNYDESSLSIRSFLDQKRSAIYVFCIISSNTNSWLQQHRAKRMREIQR
eukprot:TRINITY_DN11426_c0_g1_i1.p2 TRINITY_DN11426_c0_g1~~TRINITY_DN11426_c0_g1_i1.p2  ORF type:complete len:171 (+),score=28.98 TRINITY_DN11426_c0_g1_i1:124-636(+)